MKALASIFSAEWNRCFIARHHFLTLFLFFGILLSFSLYIFESAGKFDFIIFAGLSWLVLLLSSFLSMPVFFEQDEQRGLLDFYITSAFSLSYILFCRFFVLWIFCFLPLLSAICLLYFLMGFSLDLFWPFLLLLFVGSFILFSYLYIAAALLIGGEQNIFLLGIILTPLVIPLLLTEIHGVFLLHEGEKIDAFLWILSGISIMLGTFFPMISAWIVRQAKN